MPPVEMKITIGNIANLASVLAVLATGVTGYGKLQQGQEDQKDRIEQISKQQKDAIEDLRISEDSKISSVEKARSEDNAAFTHQMDGLISQQNLVNQQIVNQLQSIQSRIDRLIDMKRSEIPQTTTVR